MRIEKFVWPEEQIEHIARHGVMPAEVEQVCIGPAIFERGPSSGPSPVYNVLGPTIAGRFLSCVVIRLPDGRGYPVTARDMNDREKRQYRRRKRR